jgi:hypothetical protein
MRIMRLVLSSLSVERIFSKKLGWNRKDEEKLLIRNKHS